MDKEKLSFTEMEMDKMEKENFLGVSVIICCFNSARRIIPTLEHLAKQVVDNHINWEIILVDNASTDQTANIAFQSWNNMGAKTIIKIVSQPIPGLSFAREKGIEESKFEYLLYCDDDNWLSPNYVQNVFNIMNAYPEVAALGGKGIPEFEIAPPLFIKNNPGPYAVGEQHHIEGILPYTKTLYGAGTTYRKAALYILQNKGFKFYLTGRLGNKLLSGEDRELGYALSLAGYKTYYSSSLIFKHFIEEKRINIDYYYKNIEGSAYNFFILHTYYIEILKKFNKRSKIKTTFIWNFTMYNLLFFKKLFQLRKTNNRVLSIKIWYLTNTVWIKNHKTYSKLKKELTNKSILWE